MHLCPRWLENWKHDWQVLKHLANTNAHNFALTMHTAVAQILLSVVKFYLLVAMKYEVWPRSLLANGQVKCQISIKSLIYGQVTMINWYTEIQRIQSFFVFWHISTKQTASLLLERLYEYDCHSFKQDTYSIIIIVWWFLRCCIFTQVRSYILFFSALAVGQIQTLPH